MQGDTKKKQNMTQSETTLLQNVFEDNQMRDCHYLAAKEMALIHSDLKWITVA